MASFPDYESNDLQGVPVHGRKIINEERPVTREVVL